MTIKLNSQGVFLSPVNPHEYHACNDLRMVSKSILSEFAANPHVFKLKRDAGIKRSTTPNMRWGSLVDCLVLTPECVEKEYYFADDTRSNTKAGKEAIAEAERQGKTLESNEMLTRAREASSRLNEHLKGMGLVLGDTFTGQMAFASSFPVSNGGVIVIKGMSDIWPHHGNILYDVKTTSADITSERELRNVIAQFKYHVQAALYLDFANRAEGLNRFERFILVFQSREWPHLCRNVEITLSEIAKGREWYELQTDHYAECVENDEWPGQLLPDIYGGLPDWEMNKNYENQLIK